MALRFSLKWNTADSIGMYIKQTYQSICCTVSSKLLALVTNACLRMPSVNSLMFVSFPILLLLAIASVATADSDAELSAWNSCSLKTPDNGFSVPAECAYLKVATDPTNPSSDKIDLHVAKIPASNRNAEADPLLFITGGPGQAASESWPPIQAAFQKVLKNRDVYVIDQRGTGLSNKLECPEDNSPDDVFVFDAELTAQTALACYKQLPSDPRFYTTSIAVTDLESLRLAVDVKQWNIYGVSYGTRVALHYLRRYPDSVRTMTLDAVVPPGVALGPGISIDAQNALDRMFERCVSDNHCNSAFPGLKQDTLRFLDNLREKPEEIRFENFETGSLDTIRLSVHHVSLTMRILSYSSHGVSILPYLLHEAYANRNFAPLARQAALQRNQLTQTLATGMHNAIICTEDAPLARNDTSNPAEYANTYLGDTPLKALKANCTHWPAGVIDLDFHEQVTSDAQILILSGSADPVTPDTYGERLMANLPNALHIVNPNQGHVQIALGCMPTVFASFVNRGATRDVDYGCLERLRVEPFFIDANGPRP